ncbi:MAG: CBS domain-containing protein [Saprospiraceae bacterium]|nr:CBS domain-containing protein [Saprospiraceae bacterium]
MFDKHAKVRQIMTEDVIAVAPDTTMDEVAFLFKTENVHHIPVVLNHKVQGMISTTDLHKLEHHFTLFKTKNADSINRSVMRSMLAREVMSKPVATIRSEATLAQAAAFFRENLFHALPVVDGDNALVGIITPDDLMNYAYAPEEIAALDE